MSSPEFYEKQSDSPLMSFLDSVARFVAGVGTLATVVAVGFLAYYVFGGAQQANAEGGQRMVETFQTVLVLGVFGLGIGTAYLFWGEEVLGALQLIFAGALYFSPIYLPLAAGQSAQNAVAQGSMAALQAGGLSLGVVALGVIVIDVVQRVRLRLREGARAEQLKYGKGIKVERDVQNVFMGKCWQLPYCRKFVRERCPIYHSGRTCWKERVGCMCEEKVIQNAMQGIDVPRDAVAAAKFIPYNSRLSPQAKAERCRQCVIYNEHQKHKYKLAMPVCVAGILGLYALFRNPALDSIRSAVRSVDEAFGRASLEQASAAAQRAPEIGMKVFSEVLLVCVTLVVIAYAMKVIEFLFFRVKV